MNDPDIAYPQHTNENERSLALEEMDGDDEHNNSQRPSLSGKGEMFDNDAEKMKSSSYKQIHAGSVMSNRVEDGNTEGNNYEGGIEKEDKD